MADDAFDEELEYAKGLVEYETSTFTFGEHAIAIEQMEEVPAGAAIFMLAEMAENDEEISGKCLWAGSQCVCLELSQSPDLTKGKRIIELGSGTGIASILAHKLGAELVIATDGDQEVVDLLSKNAQGNSAEIHCRSLWWGDEESLQSVIDEFGKDFDVVIAGDVMYKSELVDLFFKTVCSLLKRSERDAQLLLCHIPRAGVTQEVMVAAAESCGLAHEQLPIDVDKLANCDEYDSSRACLYRFRMKE